LAVVRFRGWPVDGWISGRFGDWYERADGTRYQHRGTDIACPMRTATYWTGDVEGRLVEVYNPDGSFGLARVVECEGWFVLYAHLDSAVVDTGDVVAPGQLIGYSGESGLANGPHLHWQICRSRDFPVEIDESVDPLSLLISEEDDEMERWLLIRAADAPFADMLAAYDALRSRGYFDPWIARDGEPGPIDNRDDGWDAQARRSCLRWLAATDRAKDAVKALGWT